MTAHAFRRKRLAKGSTSSKTLSRLAVSLPPEDMALVTWFADKKGVPAAQVLRWCVEAYFKPFQNNPTLKL